MPTKRVDINKIAACLTNQHLGLILMPTEQCNFRCTYCYEDFLIGKMKPETLIAIKLFLKKRLPELTSLTVEWFGGEPLSAKKVIYTIGQFICDELPHYPKLTYRSGMTTNGYNLTENTLLTLLRLKINSFQISLDGPKEIHDTTRLRINGEGSFDKIWNNLLFMKSLPDKFEVILRIHVTPLNFQKLPRLIKKINTCFGKDIRFKVFLKAVEKLGGNNVSNFDVLSGNTKQKIIKHLYSLIESQQRSELTTKNTPPYICYAAKPNNLVIRADGTLAKCTVAFSDARNNLGKINPDGTLTIDSTKLNLWAHGLKNQNVEALHCPLQSLPTLSEKNKFPIPVKVINNTQQG